MDRVDNRAMGERMLTTQSDSGRHCVLVDPERDPGEDDDED